MIHRRIKNIELIFNEERMAKSEWRKSNFFSRLSLLFLSSIFYLLSSICYAQEPVSSTTLIEEAKKLDGQEVLYQGEVIGEVMIRGEYAWVNLNDSENAIGIWVPKNFLSGIFFAGNYDTQGDWLKVKGVFHRACKVHGGDLDIHAQEVVKLRSGRPIQHRLDNQKQKIVIWLLGVLLCLLILQLLKQKQKKK